MQDDEQVFEIGLEHSKLQQVLASRKVWASVIAALIALSLYITGGIDGDAFIRAITVIAGIFTGSVALEDGLSALISGYAEERGEDERFSL